MRGKTLVIGASGVIGGAYVRYSAGLGKPVVGLSRSPAGTGLPEIHIDLLSEQAHQPTSTGDVTHAVYAAFAPAPDDEAVRKLNGQLFKAAMDFLDGNCPALRHITLLQGMKAYGSHLGPFKTPARESDPRIPGGHFYDDQFDMLGRYALKRDWAWTALRPHVVTGPARRSPQNLIAVLGVYASLRKAQNRPLDFPGSEAAFDVVYQATDAGLLSRAIDWAGHDARAEGQIFNITNGDFFRWRHVWPKIASVFGMEPAGPSNISLAEEMTDADRLWRELTVARGLEQNALNTLVSWSFADYIFHTTWDVMADTLKCRRAGFLEFVDSEEMVLDRLHELRKIGVVP